MDSSTAVPTLMFVTIGLTLVIIGGLLVRYFRTPGNWHPMQDFHERNIDDIRRGIPPRRK